MDTIFNLVMYVLFLFIGAATTGIVFLVREERIAKKSYDVGVQVGRGQVYEEQSRTQTQAISPYSTFVSQESIAKAANIREWCSQPGLSLSGVGKSPVNTTPLAFLEGNDRHPSVPLTQLSPKTGVVPAQTGLETHQPANTLARLRKNELQRYQEQLQRNEKNVQQESLADTSIELRLFKKNDLHATILLYQRYEEVRQQLLMIEHARKPIELPVFIQSAVDIFTLTAEENKKIFPSKVPMSQYLATHKVICLCIDDQQIFAEGNSCDLCEKRLNKQETKQQTAITFCDKTSMGLPRTQGTQTLVARSQVSLDPILSYVRKNQ